MNRILPVILVTLFLIEGGILNANIPKSQHIQKVHIGPQKNFLASLAERLSEDIRNSYSFGTPKGMIASSVTVERDENNALLRRYTYGNGIDEHVAQEYMTNNGLVTVLPMYDSTGNMIGVSDNKGKLLEKYSYSVFGMPEFGYDVTPPKINSIYIGDGMFITNFSEPVKIGTVTNGMKVKHEGVVLQGTFETGAGGQEIKFIPATPLQPGQMSVDIAETVEDEAGNQMENSSSYTVIYSGAITIVHDDSAPEVDRIEKSSNDFIVIFSERIDPYTTVDSIKIKKADRSISGSIITMDERTIKFTPDEVLAANQEYMLWVNSTLKDLSGKSINQFFHRFMVLPDDFLVFERPDPNKHVYSRIGNNYLFHGREYEPEVGLYNYRNRYYMPRIGRFLQTDPTGYLDSMNLYQGFNMNPVNFTDPLGLDTDAGRIASSLSKYYESIRPKNPGPSWFDRLLGKIAVTGFQFIRDVDNIDTGHFTLQTLYDAGNLFTFGTLDRTAAQKDLDIGDRVWFFLNEMPERIQNAGTFGLLDNLRAERGNGLEGAGRAVYKTLFDLSPASNIYTIFHTDASTEDKIRAGGLFTTKVASIFLLTVNPGGSSSSGYLSQSTTRNFRTYNQLSDETFVHITTEWGAKAILEKGLDPRISGYVTKWKYVKNIDDPKLFNTKIYKQSLWTDTSSKFNEGAYILSINPIENPKYFSPFTNIVNGFPQWLFRGRPIDPSRIRLIRIIPGGN